MEKFIKIISVIFALVGIATFIFGYIRYLLIFPQGGFKILQYWWMKDYFSPDEWDVAKKCIKIMLAGFLIVIFNVLILYLLND